MDNGIYIILSRQIGLFNDMATVANNIANVNTNGYQAERLSFEQYLTRDGNIKASEKMAFANDVVTNRDTSVGSLRATGNPLDVAIKSDGFFAVETPLGVRYTRAGSFQVNAIGELTDGNGYIVQDNSGQPIVFEDGDHDISIGINGIVTVNGEERGVLALYKFDNPQLLRRVSNTHYHSDLPARLMDETEVQMAQGMLENSNVQAVLEMTHMIDVSRSVGSTAKYIETLYDLQRKTSNVLAQQS